MTHDRPAPFTGRYPRCAIVPDVHENDSLTVVARRQVTAVLQRWIIDSAPLTVRVDVDGLVDPILAAVTFRPSVTDFAADLQEILRSRTAARPSWVECLGAARDILDGYRLLTLTVTDAA